MNQQQNLFFVLGNALGEWWEARRSHQHGARSEPLPNDRSRWLPSRGNVIFTLAMIALLIIAQSAGALPLGRPLAAPNATSTGTIAYQGRLADSAGAPLTGTYSMIFRLYGMGTGGTPLWEEQWTGSNGVKVSDGLFNIMLGSLVPLQQSIIVGHDQLYLGITVGTDDEMAPRVQLGSVPFAVQALTVSDGSITQAQAPFALAGPASNYRIEVGTGPIETYSSDGMQGQKFIGYTTPFTAPPRVYLQVHDANWGTAVFSVVVANEAHGFQYRDYVTNRFGQPSISVGHYWIAIGQ